MLGVATLNEKQQLNRIIASCAFNKFNSNPCSIQFRNSSDHVVLVIIQLGRKYLMQDSQLGAVAQVTPRLESSYRHREERTTSLLIIHFGQIEHLNTRVDCLLFGEHQDHLENRGAIFGENYLDQIGIVICKY